MSLAIAWQFFNAMREADGIAKDYAKTFLLIAPNVIVLERLKLDFAGGRIFWSDPVIPRELQIFWELDCVIRGEAEKAPAEGMLFLTNIQQFYDRPDNNGDAEPDAMMAVLGQKPPKKKLDLTDFDDRIALRAGHLLVLNDEAHHTHDENNGTRRYRHWIRKPPSQSNWTSRPIPGSPRVPSSRGRSLITH